MGLFSRVALRHAQGVRSGPERAAEVGLQQTALHTVHADEDRQPLERRLEHQRPGDRPWQRLAQLDVRVRQPAVDG